MTNIELIVTPHKNDVLSGRGKFVGKYSGNSYFRELVKDYKIEYLACPKEDKGIFATIIYDAIKNLNPPGRFLKQDEKSKKWYDIGKNKAIKKIRQALRENAPEIKKCIFGPIYLEPSLQFLPSNKTTTPLMSPSPPAVAASLPLNTMTLPYPKTLVASPPATLHTKNEKYLQKESQSPPSLQCLPSNKTATPLVSPSPPAVAASPNLKTMALPYPKTLVAPPPATLHTKNEKYLQKESQSPSPSSSTDNNNPVWLGDDASSLGVMSAEYSMSKQNLMESGSSSRPESGMEKAFSVSNSTSVLHPPNKLARPKSMNNNDLEQSLDIMSLFQQSHQKILATESSSSVPISSLSSTLSLTSMDISGSMNKKEMMEMFGKYSSKESMTLSEAVDMALFDTDMNMSTLD